MLRVRTCWAYQPRPRSLLAEDGSARSPLQTTWDAFWAVRALKGESIKPQRVALPRRGGWRSRVLTAANPQEMLQVAGDWMADALDGWLPGPSLFMPVPSSRAVDAASAGTTRVAWLASHLAAAYERSIAAPSAWWSGHYPTTRAVGGSRDRAVLAGRLVVGHLPPGPIVLVDDVMTTGAHLLAVQDALHRLGRPVEFAVCAVRTLREGEELADPFQTLDAALDTDDDPQLPDER
jgi:hypothetical protein